MGPGPLDTGREMRRSDLVVQAGEGGIDKAFQGPSRALHLAGPLSVCGEEATGYGGALGALRCPLEDMIQQGDPFDLTDPTGPL